MDVQLNKLESQLKSWRKRFETFKTKVERSIPNDYSECIEDLNSKHAAVKAKVEEIKSAGKTNWHRLRVDLGIAWIELENAYADFQQSVHDAEKQQAKTKIGTQIDKSMEKPKEGRMANRPGKRINTDEEAERLDLETRTKLSDTNITCTRQQIVDRAFLLWQKRAFLPEMEEICWFQAEDELKRDG